MPIEFSTTPASGGDGPTAAQMVTLIRQALKDNPVGIVTVTVDGQTTTWSRSQALEELRFWQREAGNEAGTRRTVRQIRLDRF